MALCCCCEEYESSGDEVEDDDAVGLSHVGMAAYNTLRRKHNRHHHTLWNVTSGVVVGEVHQTPCPEYAWRSESDPPEKHDDWFPEKLCEIMSRTETWCDVMSLGPPDGLFLEQFNQALKNIAAKRDSSTSSTKRPIIVRMMFGNIIGMPVNCTAVIRALVKDVPRNGSIHLWVGAWRKGVSWNHAKIIAVDGQYLHTGGHNLWYQHYCIHNPVHDLSFELQGRVAHDGHLYANEQWAFVESIQSTCLGQCIDKMPDSLPMVANSRVTVSEFPEGQALVFPPMYRKKVVPMRDPLENEVPLISLGRYGTIIHFGQRPSDDAFVSMLNSAKTIIRLALQDIGPVCIPGTKITLPGCVWPKAYLSALGHVIWAKGVDVEIALSNPGSIPGGLAATEANYGNGWSCVDVAAEIIKTIRVQFPDADDSHLRQKVAENLRVCFVRHKNGKAWTDGTEMGMHAKHFIIDDVCTYIGSQNLYICDLGEWGVIVDHKEQTKKIMEEYWTPMWEASYTKEDCDVQEVMDGLDIDRSADDNMFVFGADKRKQKMEMMKAQTPQQNLRLDSEFFYDDEKDMS